MGHFLCSDRSGLTTSLTSVPWLRTFCGFMVSTVKHRGMSEQRSPQRQNRRGGVRDLGRASRDLSEDGEEQPDEDRQKDDANRRNESSERTVSDPRKQISPTGIRTEGELPARRGEPRAEAHHQGSPCSGRRILRGHCHHAVALPATSVPSTQRSERNGRRDGVDQNGSVWQ